MPHLKCSHVGAGAAAAAAGRWTCCVTLTEMICVRLCRVLAGVDPYHHAQLLLRIPSPACEDAAPAGAASARDQPHGLPGGLQLLRVPTSPKSA